MKTVQKIIEKITMPLGRLLALSLLLAPIGVFGDQFLDDDIYYRFESGSTTQVFVYGLRNSSATHITIPATVVYAYYDYNDLDDEGNARLKHRTCTVTRILGQAFYDNTSIRSVTVKSGMTSIENEAFSHCKGLTSISIPSSVTSIGNYAFRDCSSLASIEMPNVTSIGDYAFYHCTSLASVTMPSATSIGVSAFEYCTSLISVTIPSSVTSIGDYAFRYCSSLMSVTIPSSVTSIGSYAFQYCSSLMSVTIPSSVTSIGSYAFQYCNGIRDVTVPQCAIANPLYDSRFYCSGGVPIHRLGLDATVSAIHENAFCQCKSLTTIEVDAENEHYFVSPIDGCLYDINQTTLLCCPRDKTSITIPHGVTKIANYAFAYCSNLVSVTMPATLTTIGVNAFFDCASLPTAAIPDSVSSIANGAFGNCRKLSGVTIPSGVQALSTSAFNNCDVLWTEWYRTLADFAVNGRAYDLTQTPADRAIADVSVSGDTALDAFVLKEGKVYDSVLYIHNNAGHSVRVTLPSMPLTSYQAFKGASPLTLPAYSTSILTITRVAGGNAGGNVFLVTREELETIE